MAASRHPAPTAPPAGVVAAIATHFDGDATLYEAFAASCHTQFARDAFVGQAACQAGDAPALRRLAHDLNSVLHVLGHAPLSELAALVEREAAADDLGAGALHWQALRASLLRL